MLTGKKKSAQLLKTEKTGTLFRLFVSQVLCFYRWSALRVSLERQLTNKDDSLREKAQVCDGE